MSSFELHSDKLSPIRSEVQSVGGKLANCATKLRIQALMLKGQRGFGIEEAQQGIQALSRSALNHSQSAYATAAFLSQLDKLVNDSEESAYRVMSNTVTKDKIIKAIEDAFEKLSGGSAAGLNIPPIAAWLARYALMSPGAAIAIDLISSEGSPVAQFLKDYIGNNLKKEDSYWEKTSKNGNASIKALGYEGKVENSSIEGYLAKGEVSGESKFAKGLLGFMVGSVGASGEAKAFLFKDGKFNPGLGIGAEAEAKGITGTAEGQLGDDKFNVHGDAEGNVGYAKAEASVSADKDGIGAKAEVGAAALRGEATGGFTVFGVKVDATVEGELYGVGAKAEFGIEEDSIEVGGKLSALLGLGLKFKISW